MDFKSFISRYILLFLIIVSFFMNFWNLNSPDQVVFDEVHYGKTVNSYFKGQDHFDGHPPLAKLLISLGGLVGGYRSTEFAYNNIGDKFPDATTVSLRYMPAFFGALLPVLVYLILRKLGASKIMSSLGFLLIVFDNAILVQSRFILIDVFLLFFGLLGILLFILGKQAKNKKLLFFMLSGLSLGASVAVKWTALVFWLVVAVLAFVEPVKAALKTGISKPFLKSVSAFFVAFLILPLIIYAAIFAVHFQLQSFSGDGDAFMSDRFKSTLINSTFYTPNNQVSFLDKFTELNWVMWSSNVANLLSPHSYSSTWYNMPFMYRSIYYWTKTTDSGIERIYFIGNPVIWWSVLAVMITSTCFLIKKIITSFYRKKKRKFPEFYMLFVFGFWFNILFFILIKRVIFLYHYLPSLIFGILLLCLTSEKYFVKKERPTKYFWVFIASVVIVFLFFSPLTFGWPLDAASYNLRNWLPSWI